MVIVVIVLSGRGCLRVASAASLVFPFSLTGISASLPASALPGALTYPSNGHLFLLDVNQSYSCQPQGVWRSCQGDLHRGLVGHPALHGCPQDPHPQVLHLISLHPLTPQCSFYLSRNVTEILRLVQAFRHSDLTGHVSHKHLICRTRFAKEEDKNSINLSMS